MNILITGGTSGLGRATVELLASDSAHHVYFTFLDNDVYRFAANELTSTYSNTTAIPLDFTEESALVAFLNELPSFDLDVLVNNAYVGVPQTTHFHKIPSEDFLCSFKANVMPTIRITQAALNTFRKKKFGKIINIISSYVMNLPPIGFALYVGNKAYIEKMSDVINKEYARFNITSNCILPEFMNTGFGNVDERLIEQAESSHPLKRLLEPSEVAQAIKFFVDASQQVNGVKLPINAAQYIKN
jgi:NAD(P)-dependent dehydrogenase (short-subunit alcohol dehydrogenase family)